MDDRLKHLKENMDNTVFKNLEFRDINKNEVRKVIYNSKKNKRMKNLIPRILSLGFYLIFIIGISYFSLENLGFIQNEKPLFIQSNKNESNSNNEENNDTVYTPPKQVENYDDMSKDAILNKLLNSLDNFESASGKFETYNKYYDNSTSKFNLEYIISLKKVMGGYEKIINIPDESIPGAETMTHEYFYNNETRWDLDNDRMTYVTNDYEITPKREPVKSEDVFSIPINKLYDSKEKFRERPIGNSGMSLFNYEMIAKYLRFNNLWSIEKQNEELLGHNTIVLYGDIDKSIVDSSQPDENSFRFWVDKDTGILVKYEIYNGKGEIISYLHPESLSVNVPIDLNQFLPNLDNYNERKIEGLTFKDPNEKDIEVIEHADAIVEEVEVVLNILRSKVPFLYEFSNPKLQIFSASLEKYKEFNQAYLTYTYKKDGKEIGYIYVRTYHKDAVVSSLRDFNKEKGNEIDSFTLNGVNWMMFEIKNEPNAYLIGTSGEYMYEVFNQGEISFEETKSLLESFKKSASKQ
ncbi:hypothetical protein [Litchfieldia salsa]|nr:hypothetical protein [Litchfieldia salsa]